MRMRPRRIRANLRPVRVGGLDVHQRETSVAGRLSSEVTGIE